MGKKKKDWFPLVDFCESLPNPTGINTEDGGWWDAIIRSTPATITKEPISLLTVIYDQNHAEYLKDCERAEAFYNRVGEEIMRYCFLQTVKVGRRTCCE